MKEVLQNTVGQISDVSEWSVCEIPFNKCSIGLDGQDHFHLYFQRVLGVPWDKGSLNERFNFTSVQMLLFCNFNS